MLRDAVEAITMAAGARRVAEGLARAGGARASADAVESFVAAGAAAVR